ncbi:hypothetical protein ACLB2K_013942 [Fragaria x ananassa]
MMRVEFKVSISDESNNPLVSLFKIKLRSSITKWYIEGHFQLTPSADKTLYEVLDSMPEKTLESIYGQPGPNGATTKVHVNPSYTFKDLKEKIELDCEIPYGVQRLTEDGAELNDDLITGLYEEYYGSLEIKMELLCLNYLMFMSVWLIRVFKVLQHHK